MDRKLMKELVKFTAQEVIEPSTINDEDAESIVSDFLGEEYSRDCAFQYYNGRKIVCDKDELTLEEAKGLWSKYYDDMVEEVESGQDIEVVIWINMKKGNEYKDSIVYLYHPEVKNGQLFEPVYYGRDI